MEIKLRLQFENGELQEQWFALPLTIGKADSNELIIKSWRIAKHHVTLFYKNKKLYLEDLGSLTGTLINQQRVSHLNLINLNDQIIIGPCLIEVLQYQEQNDEINNTDSKTMASLVDYQVTNETHQNSQSSFNEKETNQLITHYVGSISSKEQQELTHMQQRLHFQLLEELDLRRNNVSVLDDETLKKQVKDHILKIIDTHKEFQKIKYKDELIQRVLDEAVGLGPLETLLKDESISEIMVNRYDEIYVERFGRLALYPLAFSSEQAVNSVIDRIVAPLGRRIDESSPMVDARLKDGSRVNAIIPPIALKGTSLTIRKFPQQRPDMDKLINLGSLDNAMSQFLDFSVKARCNLIVSGGTGSGKTTLLNVLSNCIPSQERIITIEDAAELKLNHDHLVSLEARPANAEGAGAVLIRDLVKNALRMRPDRIVVGECRGGEAFDMLAAMNTGHEGSLTTLHANSPRDALSRLEVMILMAGMDLPLHAIREHISSAIDFIVQQKRLANGKRIISSITEICGLEKGVIKTQEIFSYQQQGGGQFIGSGIIPDCFEFKQYEGQTLNIELFIQSNKQSFGLN